MKISLITVCYNSVKTLRNTFASITVQNYKNIERIVIDGGSTDGTVELIKNEENLLDFFISESDHGIYNAMNKGISKASGDVIGFINSDDFYASPCILSDVAQAFSDPSIEACYGDLCYVDPINTSRIIRYWKSNIFVPNSFSRGWCPPHPTFFVRRCVYEKFGYFDTKFKLAADFELMVRFLEKHQIHSCYIPKVFVKMRLGGATNKSLFNIYAQNKEIMRALKYNDLSVNLCKFFIFKLFSRISQYIARPNFELNK